MLELRFGLSLGFRSQLSVGACEGEGLGVGA